MKRAVDANSVTIALSLQPNLPVLMLMNFSNHLSFSIGSQSLRYSVSYAEEGVLTIFLNFSSDIEGKAAKLALSYDPTMISLTPSVLSFNMVGHNNPLNYAEPADLQSVILYLGYALDGLFLLQLFASMALHKMIGLETMQIAQTVFFVRYLLRN
jgi:hypothetical protein